MPDNWRFSEEDIEQSLRDLGARIDHPPTPDVSRAVRLRLDGEERSRPSRGIWRRPPFRAPRWAAVAAALVAISVVALSPTMRTTLFDLFVSGPQAGSESAAKPGIGGSEDRLEQEAGAPSYAKGAGKEGGATACPSPSIEATPARAARGAGFRLSGRDFSSGCDVLTPARGIRIFLRQGGKTWRLATLDADPNLAFDTRLHVPAYAASGQATLLASTGSGERVEERFVVLR
jgi:hypothetical protein